MTADTRGYEYPEAKIRVARKDQGDCEFCLTPIVAGEEYIHIAIPPWMANPEYDTDDDGRVIFLGYTKGDKWEIHNTHWDCEKLREDEEYRKGL